MANRYNETNSSGFITLNSNTVIGADNYTNQYSQAPSNSGLTPGGVTFNPRITTISGGHVVERDGDMGLYDTETGAAVRTDQCNFGGSGSNLNYPNV